MSVIMSLLLFGSILWGGGARSISGSRSVSIAVSSARVIEEEAAAGAVVEGWDCEGGGSVILGGEVGWNWGRKVGGIVEWFDMAETK